MNNYKAIVRILLLIIAVLMVIIIKQRQDINNFMEDNRRLVMMKNYQMTIIDSMSNRLLEFHPSWIYTDSIYIKNDTIFYVNGFPYESLK